MAPGTTGPRDWVPDHYRFGADGLFIVRSGTATMILPDPVDVAASDWFGGFVIQSRAFGEDWNPHHLPPGAVEPKLVAAIDRPLASLVGVVGGRPSVVGIDTAPNLDDGGSVVAVVVFDLENGDVRRLGGEFGTFGDAGGLLPTTLGGDTLGGVQFATVGSLATSRSIHFWRLEDGSEVEPAGNPFPDPCSPCEVDIRIAPDGGSFTYLYRPDAKWPADWSDAGEVDLLSREDWWESSKSIPAQLVVVDMATGTERFRLEVDAGPRLTDYDGRYAVLNGPPFEDTVPSVIVDTSQPGRVTSVPGRVALINTLAVLDGKEM